jgi:hypothetical protein
MLPPLPPLPLHASLAELEGLEIPPGAYGTGSLAWLSRALVSPLGQLGPNELRLLLGHGRGLRWLLPLALERLEREPFAGGDHGPGELLTAALSVDPAEWGRDPAWLGRLARVVADARAQAGVLPEPVRERVTADLETVRDVFGF